MSLTLNNISSTEFNNKYQDKSRINDGYRDSAKYNTTVADALKHAKENYGDLIDSKAVVHDAKILLKVFDNNDDGIISKSEFDLAQMFGADLKKYSNYFNKNKQGEYTDTSHKNLLQNMFNYIDTKLGISETYTKLKEAQKKQEKIKELDRILKNSGF